MKKQTSVFRLTPIHFCLLYFILIFCTCLIEKIENRKKENISFSYLPELSDTDLRGIPDAPAFILFQQVFILSDRRMESTLAQWAQNEKDSIYVTKVNLSKHTELGKNSGSPVHPVLLYVKMEMK
ncbi:MAG: hypothetical protein LIP05_12370 [Tannerellaceae bacterium]|nr:hypothetical protein [Tannerellaceae bacterium]